MTLVWPFCAGSLFLCVIPSLSIWGWCVVLFSDGVLADLPWCGRGCSVSCDRCRPSLWFRRNFGSRTPCCLAVYFLLLLITRPHLPLCLGFALWCCCPTACSLTCLGGDGADPYCVAVVGSHICWDVVSALVMPCVGRFVPSTTSFTSDPLYMLGVSRVLPSANGLLDD